MKNARRRIEVNLEELDRVLDGARQAPLSEEDHHSAHDVLLCAKPRVNVRPDNKASLSGSAIKLQDAVIDARRAASA
jgi:hypothetical protein